MTTLLAIFYCIDRANFLRAPAAVRDVETAHEEFRFDGLRNVAWLALIVVAVFIKSPPGVREALMLVAAIGSWRTTPAAIHARNHFTFHPIEEVAWLFAGIFAAMMPAIDYLELHSATLGVSTPAHYFWFTGILSGLLDNAPTYLTFLAAAFGRHGLSLERADDMRAFLAAHPDHLLAISLASVFFGAITYIGNGPNFMVKTICERAKVHTPGFFGYTLKFAGPVLLPVFGCVAWWCFWR